jgi:hypothetical protein
MRPRWVSRNPRPELPVVGQALVASFCPWRFYLVSTIRLDPSDPLAKLSRSLELGINYNKVPAGPDEYVTQIFRCNKHMITKSFDDPLFERHYSTLSQAFIGHNEAVDLLSKGILKLSHIRRN